MQQAALQLLTAEHALAEAEAIRSQFRRKRNKLLDGLRSIGVRFETEPDGTFYAWGDLSALPNGLNTGHELFARALERKVILVPGEFFDVDPGQRRLGRPSRFLRHARFSYGPPEGVIDRAVVQLKSLVQGHS